MRNIKLTIAYDGTKFCGWQVQENAKGKSSIQELLQQSLSTVLHEKIKLVGSGRTDSGAHALGQIASFHTKSQIPLKGIVAATNNLLPPEIAIIDAKEVAPDFHAQYSSRGKIYRYLINPASIQHPLLEERTWLIWSKLNIAAMRRGAKHLLGTHDFSSFKAAGSKVKTSVRTIKKITISNVTDNISSQSLIMISVSGSGFLRHMVRNIVGLLVEVGLGKLSADDVKKVLDKKRREPSNRCAPACGLYLVKVFY